MYFSLGWRLFLFRLFDASLNLFWLGLGKAPQRFVKRYIEFQLGF
jgi:hypothetical protein